MTLNVTGNNDENLAFDLMRLGNELLSAIEIEEAQLLSWGFVQGSFDLRTNLPRLLEKLPPSVQELWHRLQMEGHSEESLLESLLGRQLVFRLADGTFRSRFAETMRLLFLLRQRFSPLDWATAPRLVSDFRLELKRRTYPQRSASAEEVRGRLQASSLTHLQRDIIDQLLQHNLGEPMLLAAFQVDAIERQLANLRQTRPRGVVIGAGTGAGKTKAFYIPAFAHIAESIDVNSPALQAIAIYPRTELLKDQLREAFSEARKLDVLLCERGKRPISIGAYYGDTPESPDSVRNNRQWSRSDDGHGYICPYLSCPNDSNHLLLWEVTDVEAESQANRKGIYGRHTRLRCSTCSFETLPEQLALTRLQMRHSPPDILFTSTEMLNRRLSSSEDYALLGVRQPRPPRLMLLDEIHTYEGVAGAQSAYLLRRWRHARGYAHGQNLCIVGLSATLTDATRFFERLTGIPEHDIDYISPNDADLVEEGMEYNVVVKGDPVSGSSLLATSIQTAMLVSRVLDPLEHNTSLGAYGNRAFAFTDKLDVINRWYQSMYDAEFTKRLARYRVPDEKVISTLEPRKVMGQIWDMPLRLGHDLNQPLPISRTTSQDPGVNENSALVIATSTLEVGFNDPNVGAVLQHKAPRSIASFLQRKGRAGRRRQMRPWTVVVTSAYGRDRWAFQHAEDLFNPLLPPIELPIENYYVRKIQAALTVMDWAASKLGDQRQPIYVWQLLSSKNSEALRQNRNRLRHLLLELLQGTRRIEFEQYLQSALNIQGDDPAFHNILWGEPRAIYYEVVPTLLRQLETDWRKVTKDGSKSWIDAAASYPMPDFIPPALFGDLNLPEVILELPQTEKQVSAGSDPEIRTMPVAQALVEFAPGRASKRFVTHYRHDIAHWVKLPDSSQLTRSVLNLTYLPIEFEEKPYPINAHGTVYSVYRPRIFRLEQLPSNLRTTTYAEVVWKTHIEIPTQHSSRVPQYAIVSTRSRWSGLLTGIRSLTQANGTWVDIARFATGVHTDIRDKRGNAERRQLHFEDPAGTSNTGIGYTYRADALQITFAPLDVLSLRSLSVWPELKRHFAPAYFRYSLLNDVRLSASQLSSFTIDWLWQVEMSMLTATAIALKCNLPEAAQQVNANRRAFADRTLRAIFQSQYGVREQASESVDDDDEFVGKLHTQLLEAMEDRVVVETLNDAARTLWDDNSNGFDHWIEESYASSLGAVILTALTRLAPDIDPDELALDIDGHTIWLSETTAGGVGHISKITDIILHSPRSFELQLDDVVRYCDRAENASQLHRVADLIAQDDPELTTAFARARTTTDLVSLSSIKRELQETLHQRGIPATRTLLVGLNSKFLRPNSGIDSDKLACSMAQAWIDEAERLGTDIDLRAMAVAALRIPAIEMQVKEVLQRVNPESGTDENQIFNLLQSMLWLTCNDSCPECIETWQPFQPLTFPSRALIAALLLPKQPAIDVAESQWFLNAKLSLATRFEVQICCREEKKTELKAAVAQLLTTAIEIGYQHFYPFVERFFQQDNRWVVQLAMRELVGN